jgi:hypothetical protein
VKQGRGVVLKRRCKFSIKVYGLAAHDHTMVYAYIFMPPILNDIEKNLQN